MTAAGRPAVFLDRDGTLNREQGFVTTPDELVVLPGAREAVAALDAAGWPVIVITNQSGIARGLYGEADLAKVHERLHRALDGIPRAYLHCPHHPDGEPRTGAHGACACRKPAAGLLEQAARLLGVELDGSVLIGDSARDLLPARGRRLTTILVRSGKPWPQQLAQLDAAGLVPDAVVADLRAAAAWLLGRRR